MGIFGEGGADSFLMLKKMEPRKKHFWIWAEEETAFEFSFPFDESLIPPDTKLNPWFQEIAGKSADEVGVQIGNLVEELEASFFSELSALLTSCRVGLEASERCLDAIGRRPAIVPVNSSGISFTKFFDFS